MKAMRNFNPMMATAASDDHSRAYEVVDAGELDPVDRYPWNLRQSGRRSQS
jgi:acyl CoA:acetate/3-ketoacid CoA transferase alpha subunit